MNCNFDGYYTNFRPGKALQNFIIFVSVAWWQCAHMSRHPRIGQFTSSFIINRDGCRTRRAEHICLQKPPKHEQEESTHGCYNIITAVDDNEMASEVILPSNLDHTAEDDNLMIDVDPTSSLETTSAPSFPALPASRHNLLWIRDTADCDSSSPWNSGPYNSRVASRTCIIFGLHTALIVS